MADDTLLSVRDLSIDFSTAGNRLHALRNVDLEVSPGRIVGIVGESGCGKSTLASSLIGLLAANAEIVSGAIEFEGQDLARLSAGQMRAVRGRRISMVFQDPMTSLNPVVTIGRQMTDIQYREKRSAAEKRRVASDMLRTVGIPDAESRLSAYPHQFSGGMRQRICIGMALLMEPALLIADEPTTALDATLEVQVIKLLKELQRQFGCAIVFVSHHLGTVAELCDEVVVMYAGEVVERGLVRDIFRRPSHPYTQALLECDPARITAPTRKLPTIPGTLPNLVRPPNGCIFRERCPKAFARCAVEAPPEYSGAGAGHRARCHLLDETAEGTA
ncbi:ABC transporter ATP-binding protein [Aurantimonas sp. VKM B-3413]|uniref:ABC transporter ATP-binding protein n=1 Tax=Aurantimonas sp. VKM B-3413 TaxID=2779401 RepID=UPI001E571940|nr:ABC transporter ATP-binding protein [Aurantimonas sp. VKM B-3413]MCB8840390.1 ABC transporter ATP-binding protein [Aurantimonas sp. VKM B-3413]